MMLGTDDETDCEAGVGVDFSRGSMLHNHG